MSFETERKLLETQYKAGMPVGSKIHFQNTPFSEPTDGFTRITILGGKQTLIGAVGTAQRRVDGVVDVQIFVPKNTGNAGLRTIADQVDAALSYKDLSEGSIRVLTKGASLQVIGDAGNWHQGNISIPYRKDKY